MLAMFELSYIVLVKYMAFGSAYNMVGS